MFPANTTRPPAPSSKTGAQKESDMKAAREAIGRESLKSYKLAGLIAVLPTYLTYLLVHGRLSDQWGLMVVLGVYSLITGLLRRWLTSWANRHPDSFWSNLIY